MTRPQKNPRSRSLIAWRFNVIAHRERKRHNNNNTNTNAKCP